MNADYAYDIETLPNVFTCIIKRIECGTRWIFEVSPWRNQSVELSVMMRALGETGCRMVGFNNLGFDYPVLHFMCDLVAGQGHATAEQLYWKAQQIIASNDRFGHMVWDRDRIVRQLDLYKIHHFDNPAKATSLKALQFNMRSHSVDDMPFPHDHWVQPHEMLVLLTYNAHDVDETIEFYRYSAGAIKFRDELSVKLGKDFSNHNDTKIGKDYFIDRLEAASPGITRENGKPRQTPRNSIPLASVIFPYIQFQRPEFARVLDYLKTVTIRDTKSAPELKGLSAEINGFAFDFGTGGIHGSITNAHVQATDDEEIVDIDVESFYPNIAIKNKVFPAHMGELFCAIYEDLFNERRSHPKKTAPNEMLKLALNGVYGESNNKYGSFLDPAYTMTITINGQLLLCMLAEWLLTIPGLRLVQANTDGVTVVCPRTMRGELDRLCELWQSFTLLKLEYASYSDMWIRDVNSYVARSVEGKMKRIGAYAYETARENPATREIGWAKDHSALVIPKAAEAALLAGDVAAIDRFVWSHPDPWDFMLKAKAPRGSRLVLDHNAFDEPLTPTVRYYVAREGAGLVKVMPELASKPGSGERRMRINVGRLASICNVATDFRPDNLDRDFYITEARKLVGMIA